MGAQGAAGAKFERRRREDLGAEKGGDVLLPTGKGPE